MKRTSIMSFDHFFFLQHRGLIDGPHSDEWMYPSTWFKFIKLHVYIPMFIMNLSKHPTSQPRLKKKLTHERTIFDVAFLIPLIQFIGEKRETRHYNFRKEGFRRAKEKEEESSITTSLLQNHHGFVIFWFSFAYKKRMFTRKYRGGRQEITERTKREIQERIKREIPRK